MLLVPFSATDSLVVDLSLNSLACYLLDNLSRSVIAFAANAAEDLFAESLYSLAMKAKSSCLQCVISFSFSFFNSSMTSSVLNTRAIVLREYISSNLQHARQQLIRTSGITVCCLFRSGDSSRESGGVSMIIELRLLV